MDYVFVFLTMYTLNTYVYRSKWGREIITVASLSYPVDRPVGWVLMRGSEPPARLR